MKVLDSPRIAKPYLCKLMTVSRARYYKWRNRKEEKAISPLPAAPKDAGFHFVQAY